MANEEHLAILKKGVAAWNEWREQHPDIRPKLYEANLRQADLSAADLGGADFRGATLSGASLSEANLSRADLSWADLSGADFRGATLSGATLSGANLGGASLSGATLSGADLGEANLGGANLSGADLRGANLLNATLKAANFRRADLNGANLTCADLSGADLSGVDLRWADIKTATLSETGLNQATFGATILADVDLSTAKGLETVQHYGPSTIGVDTIYRSKGKIPEVFLRGVGLPDEFIAYIGSLVHRPIEFYSCFISYSSKDQEFADRLYEGLQNKGVRCWFAPHDIQGGRKIHEQLDEAIRVHDKLLLILSEHSMNSDWVKTEILRAQKREIEENKSPTLSSKDDDKDGAPTRKKKQILFPITLVSYAALEHWEYPISTGIDLAEEIRQYFIPDFSNWKDHDSFQKGFEKLVKDLKSPDAGAKSAATVKD
jgi:uncharacterized protein YjbI with pentapeptide repeats